MKRSLMEKCKNNPKKSFTTKVSEHIASGFKNILISEMNIIRTNSAVLHTIYVI